MKKLILALMFMCTAGSYPNSCDIQSETEYTLVGSTVPTKILNQRPERRCLFINNKGASTVYISVSSAAPTTTEGRQILTTANFDPVDSIQDTLWAHTLIGTTSNIVVLEGK